MAKSDLIGGSLWERYSSKVNDRMMNPEHMGEITETEAHDRGARLVVADHGAEVCGDAVRLYWAVDEDTGMIVDAKYRTFGCGTAIASSDVMCEMCIGKTVDEAVQITNIDVEAALRDDPDTAAIPPQKMHCSVMAYDVIKSAAASYKGVDISVLEEEEIVCECARISLHTVKEVIKVNDLKSVEEITQFTKAGAFCKSCIRPGGHEERKYYLEDILREVRQEMDEQKTEEQQKAPVSFTEMTLIQKHQAVEEVLNSQVRPNLRMDGGNLDVIDMRDNDGSTEIIIEYQGACRGCPSAQTATLSYIEGQLRQDLDDKIRVLPQ